MDADELARIAATLVDTVTEASARARELGIDAEFRELVRHSREMHDIMIEAMVGLGPRVAERLRGRSESGQRRRRAGGARASGRRATAMIAAPVAAERCPARARTMHHSR